MFRIRIERRPEADGKFTWGGLRDAILDGFLAVSALCFLALSILCVTRDGIIIQSASLPFNAVCIAVAVTIIILVVDRFRRPLKVHGGE